MAFKRFIHTILIFTLILQLFPTNLGGKFFMFDLPEDECTQVPANQLRQIMEEEYKDIHIEHNHYLTLPSVNINNIIFHFTELLPVSQPGAIHTPPPNFQA
jgi:hypothetical protein